ncbi:Leucyl-tRNA synthetase [Coniochaeta hoffmannii]|uniref:leucine--tRNA ligase n=1 Tax=Coniochaeta hoffmannii TaxID=91930 RepID=A0AA38RJW3_9PEZI|nr:Leucyl-tRNA synthetase [Coniochaeta hoffmannii]
MQLIYGRLIAQTRLPTSSISRSCRQGLTSTFAVKSCYQALSSRRCFATTHLDLPSLDKKWQQKWQSLRTSRPPSTPSADDKSMYILPMFPYPSGFLHMGHLRVYTIADVMARFRTLQGNHVLLPMGWDAFGLPAENAAIERGINPAVWTRGNIERMKEQLGAMNGSWDWGNEIATCDPEFYKHTQKIFLMLHERGLAYQAEAEVNYDPVDKTVLANEQVDANGCSWRSGAKVEKRRLKQWFLRISEFREELLAGLDKLSEGDAWPERVLAMQKNWLGKSTGALIQFPLLAFQHDVGAHVEVYTTRPDTLFGVQYLALASTHPIVAKLAARDPELQAFLDTIPGLPPDSKVGYILPHIRAINPLAYHDSTPDETKQSIPVYVAPYVLGDYGEGAVMGVPGHDVRDHAFWKEHHYDEPVRVVLSASDDESTTAMLNEPYVDHGIMTAHSGPYKGKSSTEASKMMVAMLENAGLAKAIEKWRLRDWLISRQRYWGAPIPIVHCESCGAVPVPDEQLPVRLPEVDDHWAEGKAGNPLESHDEWVNTSCPKCGGAAKRDTDTMDTFVDSSWYYMRFIDAHNENQPFSADKVKQFLPVDLYIGGIEHAILHLLYARFIYKFLMKSPLVSGDKQEGLHEPFRRLITQGMVQGKTYTSPTNGRFLKPEEVDASDSSNPVIIATGERPNVSFEKMSKSKYNGVDPTDFIARHGADATRAHMIFQAAVGDTLNWDEDKISGVTRWLHRIHDLVIKVGKAASDTTAESSAKEHLQKCIAQRSQLSSEDAAELDADAAVWREVQKTIDSVTASYEKVYALNTVVSDLMILTNTIHSNLGRASTVVLRDALSALIRMAAPITPAFSEECWALLHPSSESVFGEASFPVTDGTLGILQPRKQNCAVQVNGKMKLVVEIPTAPDGMEGDELRDWVVGEVLKTEQARAKLGDDVRSAKTVRVVKSGKLVNFVL